ncbi:MAG: glycosyltransferase family 39 protein [Candidatus Omnitrophica bacterium]|nr:glycosyltransferase family 39 protein [Candidatus Omnitrophota bacterium]MDD5652709.1 glycosyltransferase family 39 protein [Candidatus Omnitrophota bacterium]
MNRNFLKKQGIFLLFLFALICRLPGITRPLIMDETTAVAVIKLPLEGIINAMIYNSQPPLYFYLLKLWSQISSSAWFLRLFGVLLGAGTCMLVLRTAKIAFNERISRITFLLAALSPQLVFNSQYLRPYCLATFFTACLVLILLKFIKEEKGQAAYFLLLTLTTAACFYSFYFSFLIFAALNAFCVVFLARKTRKLLIWLFSQATALTLFSFWFPVFLTQKYLIENNVTCYIKSLSDAKMGFYMGNFHVGNIFRIVLAYFSLDDILGSALRFSSHIQYKALFVTLSCIALLLLAVYVYRAIKAMFKEEKIKNISFLPLCLIFFPAGLMLIFSIGADLKLWPQNVVNMRYFGQSSLYFLIIAAFFVTGFKRKTFRITTLAMIIFLFFLADLHIYQHPFYINNSVVSYFLKHQNNGCKVIIASPSTAMGFLHPLSDKRLADYEIRIYSEDDKQNTAVKERMKHLDRFYYYFFNSAENIVLYPDLQDKFNIFAGKLGFQRQENRLFCDIISVSYYIKKRGID